MCYHSQRLPFCFFLYFSLSFTSSFSFITHFLSLLPSLYSSLPSKSKSCVAIATAAVCENYLNPSLFSLSLALFFILCVPSDIQWILFWCGNKQMSWGWKGEGREVDVRGNVGAEQQSRKRRGGIRGGKAWWPDRQPVSRREKEKKEWDRKQTQAGTDTEKQPVRRSCRYIKQKTNKQRASKERQAKGTDKQRMRQTDTQRDWPSETGQHMKQVTQERRQTCVAMVTLKPGKGRERERGSGVGDGWWWLWGGWVGVQRGRYRKHAVPMVTQTEGSWKRGSEAGTCSHTNITKETKDTWFHIHLILIMQHSEIWAAVPLCYQQKIWTNNKSFRHKK